MFVSFIYAFDKQTLWWLPSQRDLFCNQQNLMNQFRLMAELRTFWNKASPTLGVWVGGVIESREVEFGEDP